MGVLCGCVKVFVIDAVGNADNPDQNTKDYLFQSQQGLFVGLRRLGWVGVCVGRWVFIWVCESVCVGVKVWV